PQLSVEHGLGRIGFQLRLASHSVDDIDRHLDVAFDDRVTFRDARDSLFGSLTVLPLHRFQDQRNGASQKTGQYDQPESASIHSSHGASPFLLQFDYRRVMIASTSPLPPSM